MGDAAQCTCPTCGAPYEADRPRVDLDRNLFICAAGITKLKPQQAEIATILAAAFPRVSSYETLALSLYGGGDSPLDIRSVLKVQISVMRRALRPLGWNIAPVYGIGYRLERLERVGACE